MSLFLHNANVYMDNSFKKASLEISGGRIVSIFTNTVSLSKNSVDCSDLYIFPGLVDVHVHLREPGFSYKETIKSGTLAAAHGGYTAVCSMPNLNPAPDSVENLNSQLEIIKCDALIDVFPYGTITKGQRGEILSDMEKMENAVAFSDDGRGVQSDSVMLDAMKKAKTLGKMIVAHCEVNSLLNGGYIHDGKYARLNGHKGISSESEWRQVERDIELVRRTGCSYHVCHVSTKESVSLIRQAKRDGLSVSCETAPHYLVFNDMDLKDEGRFKMNPPIRDEEDRLALIEGICDGTVDMIATDHAPHSKEEKSKGLKDSLMGIVGLETSFPILYTNLVRTGVISLEKLIEIMHDNPSKRFNIGNNIAVGNVADLAIFDLNREYTITPDDFLSMGKATPFDGHRVFGKCVMTVKNGNIVWKE